MRRSATCTRHMRYMEYERLDRAPQLEREADWNGMVMPMTVDTVDDVTRSDARKDGFEGRKFTLCEGGRGDGRDVSGWDGFEKHDVKLKWSALCV